MTRLAISLLLAALPLSVMTAPPASAAPIQHMRSFGAPFHSRADYRLVPREPLRWRAGSWYHGYHGGRLAWWWIVGDSWFFYPGPVYPYPVYAPVAVQPVAPPGVAAGPAPQSWYFCDSSHSYYPYVATCSAPWRQVPAMPPVTGPSGPG